MLYKLTLIPVTAYKTASMELLFIKKSRNYWHWFSWKLIYFKMIEILKHCIYQNSCIKLHINSFEKSTNNIKFSLAFLCSWGFVTQIGIQKVEFLSSLCTQISTSWWLGKTGIQKSSLSRVYEPRFHTAGDWSSKVELNSSWSGVLKSKFSLWLGKDLDSKIWVSLLIYTPVLMSNAFRINILENERYKPQTGLRIHHISKVKRIFI